MAGGVVLLAFLLTAPLWWRCLGQGDLGLSTVLVRFLLALPLSAVGLDLVRAATRSRDTRQPDDAAAPPPPGASGPPPKQP